MSSWCSVTIGDLISHKRQLVAVDAFSPVSEVIETLNQENLISIGVYGTPGSWIGSGGVSLVAGDKQYIGVVSIIDILAFVLAGDGDVSMKLGSRIAEAVGSTNESLSLWVEPAHCSLYFTMEHLCKGTHRILVYDDSATGSTIKILTQTDVVKYIIQTDFTKYPHLKSSLEAPVMSICTPKPDCISGDMSVKSALELLLVHYAMPVVDREGHVISTFSASDLRGLQSTASAFLAEQNVEQFLRAKLEGHLNPARIVFADTTVRAAAEIMLANGLHRLWIAPSISEPLCGVVTYTDIINAVYAAEQNCSE